MKEEIKLVRVTVFTPTYNRAKTLHRVYDSLKQQSNNSFEWVVVDDGSTDNTKDVIDDYMRVAPFEIRYFKKENGGKFSTFIDGLSYAKGEFFLIADSDDEFEKETIEKFLNYFDNIAPEEKGNFSGVSCLCKYSTNGEIVGNKFPSSPMVSNAIEIEYIHNVYGEKWGILRTAVLKEFLNTNMPENVSFISESYLWFQIAEKYKTLYVNEVLRTYYVNSPGSLSMPFTTEKHPLGVYLSEEMKLQKTIKYFKYKPKKILINAIRLAYAGQKSKIRLKRAIKDKEFLYKVLILNCWTAGSILLLLRKIQWMLKNKTVV